MYTMYTILLAVVIVVEIVSCLPNGAPPRSCISMSPDPHYTVKGDVSDSQTGPSPYKLSATWDKRMELIRVEVSGDERIQGFLIQGRLARVGPAVGRFLNITENPNAVYQNCADYEFDKYSSVTHSNTAYQHSLEFYWEPPKNLTSNKQNVTFFATLAKNKVIFWEFQQSNSLPLNMDIAVDYPTKVPKIEEILTPSPRPNKASIVGIPESLVLLLTILCFLI